jgi:hypothetical protein
MKADMEICSNAAARAIGVSVEQHGRKRGLARIAALLGIASRTAAAIHYREIAASAAVEARAQAALAHILAERHAALRARVHELEQEIERHGLVVEQPRLAGLGHVPRR